MISPSLCDQDSIVALPFINPDAAEQQRAPDNIRRALAVTGAREVPLTKGYVALVDEADYEAVAQFKWCAAVAGNGFVYAARNASIRGGLPRRRIWLHRWLLDAPSGSMVDHANHDTLDCRRGNLRVATNSQNNANARCAPAKHGFRGVKELAGRNGRGRGGFYGYVHVGRKPIYSTRCETAVDAAVARDHLARLHHGPFAVLNFPELAA